MRSKAFFVNGGAGRVICSIPAFEKYAETHDDFIIVCEGGTDFFKGHPTLDGKVYDNWHKGLFQKELINRDIVSTEPYRVWEYYNQKCSLAQAYDIQINELDEPRELPVPTIELAKMEAIQGFQAVEEVKQGTGKDKVIVIQPFGRSVEQVGDDFIADITSRSFPLNAIVEIINELKKDYGVIIMSEIHFPVEENEEKAKIKVARPQISDMRTWGGIIMAADHFLGCDSMGQHLARAFGKTATVVTGSTYPINISYPDCKDFDIIDVGEGRREYSPIRLTTDERVDRYNDQAMELDKDQIRSILTSVRKRMGKSTAYTNYKKQTQPQQKDCCAPKANMNLNASPTYGVPKNTAKPQLKPSSTKGFMADVKNAAPKSNVEGQVKDILKNLK
tara:strand:+ start:4021 stop:5190 length:1170 start_codon:yes stop_codon:yes gene_type:complete